jgi:hypothetical protein
MCRKPPIFVVYDVIYFVYIFFVGADTYSISFGRKVFDFVFFFYAFLQVI